MDNSAQAQLFSDLKAGVCKIFGAFDSLSSTIFNWRHGSEYVKKAESYSFLGISFIVDAVKPFIKYDDFNYIMGDGSVLLTPVAESLNVTIDQVNFFFSHIVAIVLGNLFRVLLPASRVGARCRHMIEICLGILLYYFCFGSRMIHVVVQSLVAYLLMISGLRKPFFMKLVLIYISGYLSICHLHRMMSDYGGYSLDITGPLMINTQKLTSLAFHIKDGNSNELSSSSAKHALRKIPRLHEFMSYIFCFHNISCGPFCFYKDYIAFIDGSQLTEQKINRNPSPVRAIFFKLGLATFFGVVTVFVAPYWPMTMLSDATFGNLSFIYKNLLLLFICMIHRYKYYFAWTLEASNLSAGLGFNGFDANGKAKWDLVDNVDIFKTEFATNMRQFVNNWNKSTTSWLRYIVYERTNKVLLVFLVSALWHGFYPGYFITFLSAGVFLVAARKLRKLLEPHFEIMKEKKKLIIYDLVSLPITNLCMCYIGFPFILLQATPIFYVYLYLYFYLHILIVTTLIIFKTTNIKPLKFN